MERHISDNQQLTHKQRNPVMGPTFASLTNKRKDSTISGQRSAPTVFNTAGKLNAQWKLTSGSTTAFVNDGILVNFFSISLLMVDVSKVAKKGPRISYAALRTHREI
jgi:hypothetical protein